MLDNCGCKLSEYITLVALPGQQFLRERASMLRLYITLSYFEIQKKIIRIITEFKLDSHIEIYKHLRP
jgi:hypothetical protein